MESVFKMFITVVFLFFLIVGLATTIGYSCGSCKGVDDISSTPCIPVLSNGDENPHYKNAWHSCKRGCIGKRNIILDVKTCNCSCEE